MQPVVEEAVFIWVKVVLPHYKTTQLQFKALHSKLCFSKSTYSKYYRQNCTSIAKVLLYIYIIEVNY